MEYLWVVAGGFIGWIGIEVMITSTNHTCPVIFNIAMAFVGALTAYTLVV